MITLENCMHENINSQYYCVDCGILIRQFFVEDSKNFTSPHCNVKVPTKNIVKDLVNLEIEEDIKHKANEIFRELTNKTPKIKKRKQSLFFCLYEACKQLEIKKDSHILAKLVDLPIKDIPVALTAFSTTQTGYKTIITHTTAIDLIPEYCERLSKGGYFTFEQTQIEDVKKMSETIFKNDPELKEEMPRKMVAGILKYYMCVNGITYDKIDFTKVIGFSEATLNILFKKISPAYIKN